MVGLNGTKMENYIKKTDLLGNWLILRNNGIKMVNYIEKNGPPTELVNGELHREDGSAIELINCREKWYKKWEYIS